MSKINILKSKTTNRRAGEFNHYKGNDIRIKISFQGNIDREKKVLAFLKKNFTVTDLSQNSNKVGRGSISHVGKRGRNRERHTANGLCANCSQKAIPGKKLCKVHRDKAKKKRDLKLSLSNDRKHL